MTNPFEARRFREDYARIGAAIRRELESPWLCPGCGGPKSEQRPRCFGCAEILRDELQRAEAARG